MLSVIEEMPRELLTLPSDKIYRVLKGPTLIHLPGRRPEPLFVSLLLHGNEDTGYLAMQRLLQTHQGKELPRALSLFIGNVEASRYRKRRLEHQPDYNRIWRGKGTPEHQMVQDVLEEMRKKQVFASIDVHNNTGVNPHYACVNRLDNRFFYLALLFSRTVVYFIKPAGVQTNAFADFCPAVTVECGHVGDRGGIDHAFRFLDAALHLAEIPDHEVAPSDIGLFHTVATVKIPATAGLRIGQGDEDFQLEPNLDHLNFTELNPNTRLGWIRPGSKLRLEVLDETGGEVGDYYFHYENNEIRTRVPVMPSMFTLNKEVIRQDVLGYLMERMSLNL